MLREPAAAAAAGTWTTPSGDVPSQVVLAAYVLVACVLAVLLVRLACRPFTRAEHAFTPSRGVRTRGQRKKLPPPREGQERFLNKDGLLIAYRVWTRDTNKPKACIVVLHGVAEHHGRYARLATELCSKLGVAVIALDHQGHGQSEGDRLFTVAFEDYVDDVFALCDIAAKRFPKTPLIALGHSMGGLIAIRAVEREQERFSMAILSAPALSLNVTQRQLSLAPLLGEYLPQFPTREIDPEQLCTDASVVDQYVNDPLVVHHGVSARLGSEVLSAIDKALAFSPELKLPILLMHGAEDKIVLRTNLVSFFQAVQSKDKTFLEFDRCKHEILCEPNGNAQAAVLAWLQKRLP